MERIKLLLFINLILIMPFSLRSQDIEVYVNGTLEKLTYSTDAVAIFFNDSVSFDMALSLVQKEKKSLRFILPEKYHFNNSMIIHLEKGASLDEINELTRAVLARPEVKKVINFYRAKDGVLQGPDNMFFAKLKPATNLTEVEKLAERANLRILGANKWDQRILEIECVSSSSISSVDACAMFYEAGLFEYAEPNFIRLLSPHTNDPEYNKQWGLDNTGNQIQYDGFPNSGLPDADIDADEAWNITAGSSSIRVAVIDEGIDLNHQDLVTNLVAGYDATGMGSNGNYSADDAHGTACAGIIAAEANNSIGIAGVAYNARIVPIRIATQDALGNWVTSDQIIADGINWAYQPGPSTGAADILSNSWGGGNPSGIIDNAIQGAVINGRGGLGSVVLFSSGNYNTSVMYPATLDDVIAVGASSMCDERKSLASCDGENWGSNYGPELDVVAPGVKIFTTDISGGSGYASDDYYDRFNGTSSACPHVAGVAALILSLNPDLSNVDVRNAIESTCDKIDNIPYSNVTGHPNGTWNNELGYGRVNAFSALTYVQANYLDADFTASSTNVPIGTNVTFTDLSTGAISSRNWTFNSASPSSSTLSTKTVTYNTVGQFDVALYIEDATGNNDTETKFNYINVYDPNANLSVVAEFTSNVSYVPVGSTVTFTDLSTGLVTSRTWTFGVGANPLSSSSQNPSVVYNTPGVYDITLVVSDNFGNSDTKTKSGHIVVYDPITCLDSETINPFYSQTMRKWQILSSSSPVVYTYESNTAVGLYEQQNVQGGSIHRYEYVSRARFYHSQYLNSQIENIRFKINVEYDDVSPNPDLKMYIVALDYSTSNLINWSGVATVSSQAQQFQDILLCPNALIGEVFVSDGDDYLYQVDYNNSNNPSNLSYLDPGANHFDIAFYFDAGYGGYGKINIGSIDVEVTYRKEPVADFVASNSVVQVGQNVQLEDLTLNCPTSWSWNFGNGGAGNSSQQNPSISYSSTGLKTVSLTSTNSVGSDSETKYDLIHVVGQVQATTSGDITLCEGDVGTVYVTPSGSAGPYTINWQPTNGVIGANNNNQLVIGPTVSQTYTAYVTDVYGFTTSSSVNVTVNPKPTVSAGVDKFICPDGGTALLGSSLNAGYTYSWIPNTPFMDDPSSATPLITNPQSDQTYQLTVIDGNGCSATDLVTVFVKRPIADAGNDQYICEGDNVTIGASPSGYGTVGPYTYVWSPVSSLDDAALGNPEVVGATSDITYNLVVEDANGCLSNVSDPISVYISNIYPVADAGPDLTTCDNESIEIGGTPTGSGASGVFSYEWFPPFVGSDVSNPIVLNNDNVTYSVVVTDQYGCSSQDEMELTILPSPLANAGVDEVVCLGNQTAIGGGQVVTNGVPYSSFFWSPSPYIDDVNAQNPIVNGLPLGSSQFVINVIADNGCLDDDIVVVNVEEPITNATLGYQGIADIDLCPTGSNSTTVLEAQADGNIQFLRWFKDGVLITGVNSNMYTVSQAGDYLVELVNTCGNAWSNVSTVTKEPLPTVSIADLSVCHNEVITLTPDVTPLNSILSPYNFEWSGNAIDFSCTSCENPEYRGGDTPVDPMNINLWVADSRGFSTGCYSSIQFSIDQDDPISFINNYEYVCGSFVSGTSDHREAYERIYAGDACTGGETTFEPASEMTMVSSRSILLQEGFHAKEGSDVHAFIGYFCGIDERLVNADSLVKEAIEFNYSEDDRESERNDLKKLDENFVTMYPNPTVDGFTVEVSDNDKLKSIQVIDMTGKQVLLTNIFAYQGFYTHHFDMSNYSSGIYYIMFRFENKTLRRRIVYGK